MKQLILLILVLFAGLTFKSYGQDISDKQITFANGFINAVVNHNSKSIVKHLEKNYRKEQLKFLEGRTEQFINELFSGNDMISDEYVNIKYQEITKIEISEIILLKEGGYTYIFRIRDGKHDVLCSLHLAKNDKKYGFIGSVG